MDLEEIKNRAEGLTHRLFDNNTRWAANTILQLVAEVESLMSQLGVSVQRTVDVKEENEKLTAANKIMLEALEKVNRGPEFTKAESVLLTTEDCLEKVAKFSQDTAHEALKKLGVD